MSKESENHEPTVFVIQDPQNKNLESAKRFGKIEVILTGKEDNERGANLLMRRLMTFHENDLLLLLGNPLFIGVAVHACMIALNGKISVLIWDKKHLDYVKHEVVL